MRIGSNFVDVLPPVLRSLFFPQRQSYNSMHVASRIDANAQSPTSKTMRVVFSISFLNEGSATANNFMALETSQKGKQYNAKTLWTSFSTKLGDKFIYMEPFHPGETVELADVAFDVPAALGARGDECVDLEFQLYATDQAPKIVRIHYPLLDIKDQEKRSALPEPLPIPRFW